MATTSSLKLIDATTPIIDPVKGIVKQTRNYELNGEKFMIVYENSNGSPLGFNSKMCLRQYSKLNACWNSLEDISVIRSKVGDTPSYYARTSEPENHMKSFFKHMEARLVTIYS